MFIHHSRYLTRGEVWFDNPPDPTPVDWIYYRERSAPVAGARWRHCYTRLIDLEQSPAELEAGLEEKTRTKIHAAMEQDQTRCITCDPADPVVLNEVEAMWNRRAELGISVAPFDRAALEVLIAGKALDISAARDPLGNTLSYQASFVDPVRVQQLLLVATTTAVASPRGRLLINRANCLLLWDLIRRMKTRGARRFDFGGWYPGRTHIQLLGMNAFKQGFGGFVVREYKCHQICTLRGWIVLTVARWLQRNPEPRMHRGPDPQQGEPCPRSSTPNTCSASMTSAPR